MVEEGYEIMIFCVNEFNEFHGFMGDERETRDGKKEGKNMGCFI